MMASNLMLVEGDIHSSQTLVGIPESELAPRFTLVNFGSAHLKVRGMWSEIRRNPADQLRWCCCMW